MASKAPTKCYYSILQVDINASEEEIKKSYRRLALACHPDKNVDSNEENNTKITQQFQQIQRAYEVLSDVKERSWYDRHRDAILRGVHDEDIADDGLDLMPFFTSFCYGKLNDDQDGFYTVYRNVFKELAKEELIYCAEDVKEKNLPEFGDSNTPYEQVHQFYSYWQSFCTSKTFSWLEKYDVREAPNRRVARLIEKENKKERDAGKKLRNELVRQLVAFVRKRDKRVIEHRKIMEKKSEQNKKKVQEMRRKQIEERNQLLQSEYQETEWTSMAKLEDELKEIESRYDSDAEENRCTKDNDGNSNDDDDDDDDQISDLYCLACDKMFKSEKAFENHENSKKHKSNVNHLKAAMELDESRLKDQLDQHEKDNKLDEGLQAQNGHQIEIEDEEEEEKQRNRKERKNRRKNKKRTQL